MSNLPSEPEFEQAYKGERPPPIVSDIGGTSKPPRETVISFSATDTNV